MRPQSYLTKNMFTCRKHVLLFSECWLDRIGRAERKTRMGRMRYVELENFDPKITERHVI